MKKIFYGVVLTLLTILVIPNNVSAATTAEESWNKIIATMKNSEMIQKLDDEEGNTLTITSDDKTLVFEVAYDGLETYNITYSHYNGMVYFATTNTKDDVLLALTESIIHYEFLTAVADVYGYDIVDFIEWIENIDGTKLVYENDGIEFTEYTLSEDDITVTTLETLKINIDCGVASYAPVETPEEPEQPVVPEDPADPTPEKPVVPEDPADPTPEPEQPVVPTEPKENVETTVENPVTGLQLSLGLFMVAIVGVLVFIVSKKKTYFSKI